VVVTVFGIWLGWNAEIVRERTAMRNTIRRSGGYIILDHAVLGPLDKNGNDVIDNQLFDLVGGDYQIPFVRRVLGDERVVFILVKEKAGLDHIKRVFPECAVTVDDHPFEQYLEFPD